MWLKNVNKNSCSSLEVDASSWEEVVVLRVGEVVGEMLELSSWNILASPLSLWDNFLALKERCEDGGQQLNSVELEGSLIAELSLSNSESNWDLNVQGINVNSISNLSGV